MCLSSHSHCESCVLLWWDGCVQKLSRRPVKAPSVRLTHYADVSNLLLRKALFPFAHAVVKRLRSLPFILLTQTPERFWRVCMHGKVCFRYNVCVDRCSAFFSWLSVEQSLTSKSQLPYLVTPQRRYIPNRWTWHLFRHQLRQPLLRLLLCKGELLKW